MYECALSKGSVLQGGKYPYRIEEVLGQGSYGITYKVSAEVSFGNITNKIYFAVKENFTKKYCSRKADGVTMKFPAEFASDVERDLEDFLTEGKRLNQICKSSKHIVKVNETWQENDTAYYAMEYIDGGSLSDYVISKGRLSEKEALKIFMPILEAVSSVHQYQLLHLDIKPENIMLERQNDGQFTPILIDFGITLHFDQSGSITKTSKDHSIGCSDGYAPIEQYSGINQFAPEVDVYALGAVLYYMLVGRDPMRSIDCNAKKIDANLPAETSNQVRVAILHAMNCLRDERTQSVNDFIAELEAKEVTKKEPPVKDELPSGAIVKGGYVDYQIVQVKSNGDCYIEYSAVRYTGEQHGGNATQKATYTIYEYFVKGIHQCLKDSKVKQKYPNEETRKAFLQLAEQKTGLKIGNNKHVADKSHSHEVFKANGTYYVIVKDGSEIEKPEPPHPEPPTPAPDPDFNKWMKIGAVIVGLLVVFAVWKNIPVTPESPTEPVPADTVVVEDPEGKKDTLSQSQREKEPQKDVNPSKQKEEKQIVEKQPEQVVQPKETDEQIYSRALQNGDWTTMRKLANKGYTAACGALAKHYVTSSATSENHKQAYNWAQRASGADKKYVMDILEKYGFLVNGKPVVE